MRYGRDSVTDRVLDQFWTNGRSEGGGKEERKCLRAAEGVGFEPTGSLHSQGFSRANDLVAPVGSERPELVKCKGRGAQIGWGGPEGAGDYGQNYGQPAQRRGARAGPSQLAAISGRRQRARSPVSAPSRRLGTSPRRGNRLAHPAGINTRLEGRAGPLRPQRLRRRAIPDAATSSEATSI
jgi:hypothetical protein